MFKKIHFSSIDSTHKWALRNIDSLPPTPLFIHADYQTEGVGLKGDKWIAPTRTNLLATFVFPLTDDFPLQNIAQVLAHSTICLLEKLQFSPLFKWPNDLLLDNKKVGGVMAEVKNQSVFVSIGLNVNMHPKDLALVDQPATSLLEQQKEYDLNQFTDMLINQFENDLYLFKQKGFTPFYKSFASHLAHIGKKASINNQIGTIKGLNEDGQLVLLCNNQKKLFATGSLSIL